MAYLNEISVGGTAYDLRQKYPVGAIFLSTDAASPAELFGGTWERITDRFLLAAGTAYTAGTTGGEAAHTLTVSELPSHTHAVPGYWGFQQGTGARYEVLSNDGTTEYDSRETGENQSHNNMPPYLAVYAWKRVA